MKKLLLIILMGACCCLTKAQPQPGSISVTPKAGMTFSRPTGGPATIKQYVHHFYDYYTDGLENFNALSSMTVAHTRKGGFTVGADFQYQVASGFGLVSGLNFAQLRSSVDLERASYGSITNQEITGISNYLQVPFLVKGYLYKGLSIQVGLQFDWNMKSKADISYDFLGQRINSGSAFTSVNNKEYYVKVSVPHMDNMKKFGLSVPMGISYEYRKLELSAMYNISATRSTDTDWEKESGCNLRNSTFLFTLGYRISFGGDK